MKTSNEKNKVYLDWAATYKPNEKAIRMSTEMAFEYFANPSSAHSLGLDAKTVLEKSRLEIANSIGANSNQIYFTSGGTESNHIPMLSVLTKPYLVNCSIAVSEIEHSAVLKQTELLKRFGVEVLKIPANKFGVITPENVLKTIKDNTVFVSVMMINNETGIIQPIKNISNAIRQTSKRQIHFHTDAVQSVGKIPVNVLELGVDSLALAGHKIGASRGIGAVYLKKTIEPFLHGGGQEGGIRPGTQNLAGIISLATCVKEMCNSVNENFNQTSIVMSYLVSELSKIKGLLVIPQERGKYEDSKKRFSPYIMQFADENITGAVLVRCLSDEGIFVSSGSACSFKKKIKPILTALGILPSLQQNVVRVSIGHNTTKDEIDAFLIALKKIKKSLC